MKFEEIKEVLDVFANAGISGGSVFCGDNIFDAYHSVVALLHALEKKENSPGGSDIKELFERVRSFCASRKVTLITPTDEYRYSDKTLFTPFGEITINQYGYLKFSQ